MSQPIEAPTPEALADLVARCAQINRYATELASAEETRIAALASGILVMRQVLDLAPIDAEKLPPHQARIAHWALTGDHLPAVGDGALRHLHGVLVLDEHEQVKILSQRTWRGVYRRVTLWRDGVHALSAAELMDYLARLTALAQQRAPDVARTLLERSQAIMATHTMLGAAPRPRG